MIPIKNQIIFKPLPSAETTETGLFVPENVREVNDKGVVIKVGAGTKERPMRLKEWDVVHRVHLWGEPIMLDGETFYMMDEKAIIAIE